MCELRIKIPSWANNTNSSSSTDSPSDGLGSATPAPRRDSIAVTGDVDELRTSLASRSAVVVPGSGDASGDAYVVVRPAELACIISLVLILLSLIALFISVPFWV